MNELFRARFMGHETPVDPGVWQAIRADLAAAPQGEALEDLMRERLQGHESAPPPSAWSNIQQQLGQGAAAPPADSGGWSAWGWAASGLAVVAVTVGLYVGLSPEKGSALAVVTPKAAQANSVGPETTETDQTLVSEPSEEHGLPVNEEVASGQASAASAPAVMEPAPVPDLSVGEATKAEEADAAAPEAPSATPSNQTDQTAQGSVAPPAVNDAADGPAFVQGILDEMTRAADLEAKRQQPRPAPEQPELEPVWEPDPFEPAFAAPQPQLYMPSTFTPNGDGINDTYEVVADGFAQVRIRVFSVLNNQLVFSTDHGRPWNGANCSTGHYVVAVEAITAEGRLVTQGKVVYLNADP